VLDLGPRARLAFAACWIVAQGALVLTASIRSDRIFGFRMFSEASTLEIHLSRQLRDSVVPAPSGEWSARDMAGQLRHFSWHDRVHDPTLRALDARVFASYGTGTQLARLQRALDDVAEHTPEDAETERLRADVTVWKNGRAPMAVVLRSEPRPAATTHGRSGTGERD
jgi:hypothetical protein